MPLLVLRESSLRSLLPKWYSRLARFWVWHVPRWHPRPGDSGDTWRGGRRRGLEGTKGDGVRIPGFSPGLGGREGGSQDTLFLPLPLGEVWGGGRGRSNRLIAVGL